MELLINLSPIIIIIAVFYFFIIRPQQKQQKERQDMLNSLKAGNEVITIGGIKGKIIKIKEDNIRLRISSNVDIDITRKGIGSVAEAEDDKIEDKNENDQKEEEEKKEEEESK